MVVGLDIGTSNIRVAIGEVNESGAVEIVGTACKKSVGLKDGVQKSRLPISIFGRMKKLGVMLYPSVSSSRYLIAFGFFCVLKWYCSMLYCIALRA